MYSSYFSFDFDLFYDRLLGSIRACNSDSLAFNVAFPFKYLHIVESRLFGSMVRALVLYLGGLGSTPSHGMEKSSAMLYTCYGYHVKRTLIIFLKEYFENINFKKNQQTTTKTASWYLLT